MREKVLLIKKNFVRRETGRGLGGEKCVVMLGRKCGKNDGRRSSKSEAKNVGYKKVT